ncbi:MAG: hypothetical protein KDK39_05165 [Leptospiraceae bacterium]|nr:hypothetical protein [Leptospiraceae bacterium]
MILQTRGYLVDQTVVWELRDDQFDFGLSEFQELIPAIRQRGLFEWLDDNRPALKARLLHLFERELATAELEADDLEVELENNLRNLARRLRL